MGWIALEITLCFQARKQHARSDESQLPLITWTLQDSHISVLCGYRCLTTFCLVYTCAVRLAGSDLDQLCQDFPEFDRSLLEGMIADQGGDMPEVHACLRV